MSSETATISGAFSGAIPLLHQGKVRDTYSVDDPTKILLTATDRVSIFDFVLPSMIPMKGPILTAMTHFWLRHFERFGVQSHLVAAGEAIDVYLPESLRGNPELQSRSMVVKKLTMSPVEFIGRQHLTGSALKSYLENGTACGQRLPEGLQDGDRLPYFMDTPTTKAEQGHDLDMDAREVRAQYADETHLLRMLFEIAYRCAAEHGIILADTKLEFGRDRDGKLLVGDEVFTPDSSRFWDAREWNQIQGRDEGRTSPQPFDKELVREWGKGHGIHDLDPANPDHVAQVQALQVPHEIVRATTQTYRYIFCRLTGMTIERYLASELGVIFDVPKRNVALVLGSESDLPDVRAALGTVMDDTGQIGKVTVHVLSCHRNSVELQQFVRERCGEADVVVAVGGKALALPGMLTTYLGDEGLDIPVIGVGLGEPGTEAFEAARLSIKELPGTPVIMDEVAGEPYMGRQGLHAAFQRLEIGELPPPKKRTKKAPQLNIELF